MNPLWCTLQFPLKGTLGGLYPSGLAVEGPTSPRGKVARFFFFSIPETIWNHLKLSGTIWNYLELFGTIWNGLRPLEQSLRLYLERPSGLLERPPALDRPQGYFVLFIGSRYYLRPIILWNARRAIGTAIRASGTEPSALPGTPEGLLKQPSGLLEQSLWLYLERAWRSGITRIRRLRYRCYRCCRSQSRKARGHQLLPIKSPSHAVECTTILGDEISHLYLFNVAIRIEFSQLR